MAGVALAADFKAAAAPFRPSDDAAVLERLPGAGNKTAGELRELHAELARSPQNLPLALRVARRDIAMARGDIRQRTLVHFKALEPVEDVLWQAGEQLAREPSVAVHEFLSGVAAPFGCTARMAPDMIINLAELPSPSTGATYGGTASR